MDGPKASAPHFAYTQRKFWGGATSDYITLTILSCLPLTGLLGLDHLYLRSPLTALAKICFNVLTLGFWYFYDIAQLIGERDKVKEIGLSVPFYGPTGLAAGSFKGGSAGSSAAGAAEPVGPSSGRFLAYAIAALLPLPFAQDFFIAGDTSGAVLKLIANFTPIFWLFSIMWGLYNLYKLFFKTEDLLTKGITHIYPFDNFCPRNTLGPDRECIGQQKPEQKEGLFVRFLSHIPLINRLVRPAYDTAKAVVQPAYDTAKALAEKTVETVETVKPIITDAVTAVPRVATQTVSSLGQMTTKEGLMALAQKSSGQKGGKAEAEDITFPLMVLIGGCAASGYFFAKLRQNPYIKMIPDYFQKTLKVPVYAGLPPH